MAIIVNPIKQSVDTKESAKRALSTGYVAGYSRTNFMQIVESTYFDQSPWIDPLDPRILSLFAGTTQYIGFQYRNEALTTITMNYYNNTTLWYAIVMFNGFIHPLEIPSGHILKIPSLTKIQASIKNIQATRSLTGQVVTI